MFDRRHITEWISRSIPVLLVAFLWAGLWWMWPENVLQEWKAPRKPFRIELISNASAMHFAEDPTAFAFDSSAAYKKSGGEDHEVLRMPGMPEGPRRAVDMSGQVFTSSARRPVSEYSVWKKDKSVYEPAWSGKAVFERMEQEDQLVVELSAGLLASGYEPGEFSDEELKGLAAGWEVRMLLDIDKTGFPEHVLIEKGSGNADIDALVYRKVLSGKPGSKELRGGRLKISYGFE